MTPPTATPTARRTARQATQRRIPRRVSGPVTGRAQAPTAYRTAPQPARAPRVRTHTPRRPVSRITARALAVVRALPDHALLDRIVRGRAWIPLLGVMLAGIVAMQVEVLKLGASIGRSIQRSTALTSRNELLRANVSALSDDGRIERLAAQMGMVMPEPTQVGFLSARPGGDLARAVANIHPPNPALFESLVTPNGGVVTGITTTSATPTAATTASAAPTTTTPATPSTGPATTTPASTPGG